jgi:putative chitinase
VTIRVTPDLLVAAMGCTRERADRYAAHLDAACLAGGISTGMAGVARLAQFLAQLGHESGALVYVREIADGSAYEGRADLGNTQPGDGRRYRGRGLIQTTGRANYRKTRGWLAALNVRDAPDFEAEPELLETPQWAAWSAVGFWHANKLNVVADGDDLTACIRVGRGVNRGNVNDARPANGEDDRIKRWRRARAAVAAAAGTPTAQQQPAPVVTATTVPVSQSQPSPPASAPAQEQSMPPSLLAGLASTVINLFTPIAAEKLRKEIGRHTDDSSVAEQLTAGVIDAAKAATGMSDPIQAVAAVQSDPAALERAEAGAMQSLDRLLPLIERINAMEQGNIRAAREFNAAEPLFIDTPWIRMKFVHLLSLVFVTFSGWFVLENWGSLTPELKGAVITLMVIAGWNGVRDYWMGSSNGSAEKTAMLTSAEAAQRRPGG